MNERLVKAFNEWMRRYTQTPEQFDREFQTIQKFLKDKSENRTPSYGEECVEYLEKLLNEIGPPNSEGILC